MNPQKIKKLIVHYENGQTDEWEGEGHTNITETYRVDEVFEDGKMKKKAVSVRYMSAQISLPPGPPPAVPLT